MKCGSLARKARTVKLQVPSRACKVCRCWLDFIITRSNIMSLSNDIIWNYNLF